MLTLEDAEMEVYGRTYLDPEVRVGDKVDLGGYFYATITQAGIDCDCGKGVLCPLNPQTRK